MTEDFGQTASPLASLRSILGRYPFSVGLLREIVSNSDDAGASKQTFVLDRRCYPTEFLYHSGLSSTQGPALLAFNDAKFAERDWYALQYAYESSKADDSTKIGKYGVGFRSIFHVTDCPQILSGNILAMFDPARAFTGTNGIKKDLSLFSSQYPDQLLAFQWFSDSIQSNFDGTIIRCPLRDSTSKISPSLKVVDPNTITGLFRDFIKEELGISLLFLQNINQVEIHDVDLQGVSTCLARLSISRSTPVPCGNGNETYIATVSTEISSAVHEKTWLILTCPFQKDEAIQLLSKGFPGDPTAILKEHKLLPSISFATPLSPNIADQTGGRLFTYLPLPLPTGFCAHIHALFAITDSRQNLRNPREVGIGQGSNDEILIRWNWLLFENYIPQAWNQLLEVLVRTNGTINIFSAWPPEQRSRATSGESVYWEQLPSHVFKFVTSSKSSVWPVFQIQNVTTLAAEYQALESVVVAHPTIAQTVLGALTSMGLRLTCPPVYIFELIKNAGTEFTILTPEVAHKALLNHIELLQTASNADLHIVLEYLLSTNNALNLVGLPLIPITSGEIIALETKAASTKIYTLLNRVENDVFGACDDAAILLQSFPFHVAETLRGHGQQVLNIESLSVPRIIKYLTIYPNKMGLDLSLLRTDSRVLQWLSAFWVWLSTYGLKDELYTKIRHLFLLPSTRGLRTAEKPLFKSRAEHPNSVQHLSMLGIPFLDAGLSDAAQTILGSYGLLKTISDVHGLLEALPFSSSTDSPKLPPEACTTILRHLSSRAPGSCILHGKFSSEQIRRLRCLPIFPIVEFPSISGGLVTQWTHIPDGVSLKSVASPPFLPTISGVGFLQLHTIAPAILEYIEQSGPSHLTDLDVLSLTMENFVAQPDYVHAAVLDYIVKNRQRIPPFILDFVRNAEFVATNDGSKKKPTDVVDPDSKLALLFTETPELQVRCDTTPEQSIIKSLKNLHLMQRILTTAVTQGRINFISSAPLSQTSLNLARSLLSLITIERLDCSGLKIVPEQRWLPTDQGLRGSGECRDPNQISPYLFDRVLAVLEPITMPSSLTRVLGWNEPLPTDILIKQLDGVLDSPEDMFPAVLEIIKELSMRNCSDADYELLGKITADRKWVPTTDRLLAETRNAIFTTPIVESGFHQALSIDAKTQDFLRQMGCTDKPSTQAIITKLTELQDQAPSLNTVNSALSLLRSVPVELHEDERSRLLVPDDTGTLHPFPVTYFNDIGDQVRLIPAGGTDSIAHSLLEEPLAKRLRIRPLGLKYVELSALSIDMGEKPVTTVRNTLTRYTENQFATEFLANAIDANATEFTLLLNKFHPSPDDDLRALSPIMAKFCTSPSLVVHNNAIFSDEDFIGIRRTGIGGKNEKSDTIGQFGLGVLTMFHFTELAILISNGNVLFLNPSKEHLPISDVASLMLPLNLVRKYYPGHLASIDGLFGFNVLGPIRDPG